MRVMQREISGGTGDWAYAASYYAMYFAAYAVLTRAGIKCEIHDCTIALLGHLFGESVTRDLVKDFEKAREMRIEAQYYTTMSGPVKDAGRLEAATRRFVLAMEELAERLDRDGIDGARTKLEGAIR